jgi:hypothetical protein
LVTALALCRAIDVRMFPASRSFRRTWSAACAVAALSAHAQTVADLRGDFDSPLTAHTNGQTSAGKIDDTLGTGSWNFYRSDTVNPTAGGANLTLLTYTTGSNGVRAGNAYVAPGASYDLPGWSSGVLITPAEFEGTAPANALAVHPGQFTYAVAAWTSGYAGSVNLSGAVQDLGYVSNGVTLDIWLNGSSVFTSGATSGNTPLAFNLTFAVTSSDVLYFLIGNNGDYTADGSALSATVTAIPEPSTSAAVVGIVAFGIVAARRRRTR